MKKQQKGWLCNDCETVYGPDGPDKCHNCGSDDWKEITVGACSECGQWRRTKAK
jgi:primosomal protein N'